MVKIKEFTEEIDRVSFAQEKREEKKMGTIGLFQEWKKRNIRIPLMTGGSRGERRSPGKKKTVRRGKAVQE